MKNDAEFHVTHSVVGRRHAPAGPSRTRSHRSHVRARVGAEKLKTAAGHMPITTARTPSISAARGIPRTVVV